MAGGRDVPKERVIFTAKTNIQEALDLDDRVGELFKRLGLNCIDCVAAEKETLFETALYHEKDLQQVLDALNALGVVKKEG